MADDGLVTEAGYLCVGWTSVCHPAIRRHHRDHVARMLDEGPEAFLALAQPLLGFLARRDVGAESGAANDCAAFVPDREGRDLKLLDALRRIDARSLDDGD